MIGPWALSNLQLLVPAFVLCLRAAISRDGRARKIWAVGFAFLPFFAAFIVAGISLSSGGPTTSEVGFQLHALAALAGFAPALYLIGWAFRTTDPKSQRIPCAILGVLAFLTALMVAALKIGAAGQTSISAGA